MIFRPPDVPESALKGAAETALKFIPSYVVSYLWDCSGDFLIVSGGRGVKVFIDMNFDFFRIFDD